MRFEADGFGSVLHSDDVDRSNAGSVSTVPQRLVPAFVALSERMGMALVVTARASEVGTERVVFANAAVSTLFGIRPSELVDQTTLVGKWAARFFTPENRPASSAQGPVRETLGTIQHVDGKRIAGCWTEVETVVDGAKYRVHLFRRLAKATSIEPMWIDDELRFRQLLDVAPDGILVVQERRIVYANRAITRMYGYSHPRQLAQLALDRLFSPEDREPIEEKLRLLEDVPSNSQAVEARSRRRDHSTIPVELQLLTTQWDDAPAVLVSVRDLSGRRLLQSRLVHDDRLTAVGTLAAGVAHEVNNPLAYVLLNLQYLMREVPKLRTDDERVSHLRERVQEARHGAARVASIVKDLRSFSKGQDEQLGPVDLHRVLRSAVKVARSQLMDRGTILESFSDVPPAYGNAERLEQVFLNLLVNAIQALSSDDREKNRITCRTYFEFRKTQGFVTVEVTDTGAGMTQAVLDRVFDPFYTTKPVGLGTGLGLPICHNLVTRMGGQIRAESRLGLGSSFFVSLPVSEVPRRSLTPGPFVQVTSQATRARVLVIDDEPPVANMFSRVLGEDHDVVIATSAEAALELLERQSFDGIFCDLLMPTMSGMEFYREVMRRYPGKEQRIAFMTGGAFTPRAAQFLSQVHNPRIEKPFDLRAVRAIVQNWMGHGEGVS